MRLADAGRDVRAVDEDVEQRARAGRRRSRPQRRVAGRRDGGLRGGQGIGGGGLGCDDDLEAHSFGRARGAGRGRRGGESRIVETDARLDVLFGVHAADWTARDVADSGRARRGGACALHVGLHRGRRAHLGALRAPRGGRAWAGGSTRAGPTHRRGDAAAVAASCSRRWRGRERARGAGAREGAGARRVGRGGGGARGGDRDARSGRPSWARAAALATLALSVPVAAHAVSGMETALATSLATFAVLLGAAPAASRRSWRAWRRRCGRRWRRGRASLAAGLRAWRARRVGRGGRGVGLVGARAVRGVRASSASPCGVTPRRSR